MPFSMDHSVITLLIMICSALGVLGLLLNAVLVVVAKKTGSAKSAARVLSVLLLLCSLVPILLGFAGSAYDHHLMEQALATVPVETQGGLRAAGTSVAMLPKMLGICSSMTCMLPAALLCVYAAGRRAASLDPGDEPPPSTD